MLNLQRICIRLKLMPKEKSIWNQGVSKDIVINWLQHTVAVVEKHIAMQQKFQDTLDNVWASILKNNEIRDRGDGKD